MESRLDLVDDAIQNATLFLHISKFTVCLSGTSTIRTTPECKNVYTLFTVSHFSATMYTYESHLHPQICVRTFTGGVHVHSSFNCGGIGKLITYTLPIPIIASST